MNNVLYSYKCERCGKVRDMFQQVDFRDLTGYCWWDGGKMKRMFTPPYIRGETVSKS